MNMNHMTAMSTTGVSADVSARGYADQIASHYRVREALTPELELKLEAVGEQRMRKLLRWVSDDDDTDNGTMPPLSTRSASSSVSSTDCEAPIAPPMKLMQERENYRVFEQQNEREKLLVMKGVLMLQRSSCDDVMALLSGKTGLDVQDYLSDVFATQYGDSAVLHHVDMQQHPQATARRAAAAANGSTAPQPASTTMLFQWLALRDTSPQLPLRDFLFMRFNQTFAKRSGRALAYGASVWESIEIPSCRPIFGAATMQRRRFKNCGYVVESADDDDAQNAIDATRVTFFITTALDPVTLTSDRAWLLRMAASVRLVPSALVNQRIRLNQLLHDKTQWDSRDKCALCTTTFSLMKRAHHCRLCGTSVCSKCGTLRQQNATRSRQSSPSVRVCLSCINGEDTSALWGASMSKKHLGITSSSTSVSSVGSFSASNASRAHQSQQVANGQHGARSRDSNTSKESWSERSRPSNNTSSSVDSSFSSSTRSLDEFASSSGHSNSAVADADAALASLRLKPSIAEDVDEDDVLTNTSYSYPLTFTRGAPWPDFPVPSTEAQRIERIRTLNLSQQYAKTALHELLDLARTSISCPVATVAVITQSTCLLVTSVGLAGDQLPRDVALESHVIMSHAPFVILDTLEDERFVKNPLVAQLHIRFYIGLPLVTRDGVVVGSLSLGDVSPRQKVKGSDLRSLVRLAARIVDKMDTTSAALAANGGVQAAGVDRSGSGYGSSVSHGTAPIGGMLLI